MSDSASRSNEILHACQELWRAPQNLLATDGLAERWTAAAQNIVAAQLAYAQAAMSMNAQIMRLWFEPTEDASPVHVAEDETARHHATKDHETA